MIHDVVHYIHTYTRAHPLYWLIVGKGPTSDRIDEIDTSKYHVLTLNHACRIVEPTIAHFVDIEACHNCYDVLFDRTETNGIRLVLPWHPHRDNKPGKETLLTEITKTKRGGMFWEARRYAELERLYSYNATTAGSLSKGHGLRTVNLRFFSAVSAFGLLALAGIRTVYSVGVDGGTEYGSRFDVKDKLSNGRKSFDDQMPEIAKIVRKYKMTWLQL